MASRLLPRTVFVGMGVIAGNIHKRTLWPSARAVASHFPLGEMAIGDWLSSRSGSLRWVPGTERSYRCTGWAVGPATNRVNPSGEKYKLNNTEMSVVQDWSDR